MRLGQNNTVTASLVGLATRDPTMLSPTSGSSDCSAGSSSVTGGSTRASSTWSPTLLAKPGPAWPQQSGRRQRLSHGLASPVTAPLANCQQGRCHSPQSHDLRIYWLGARAARAFSYVGNSVSREIIFRNFRYEFRLTAPSADHILSFCDRAVPFRTVEGGSWIRYRGLPLKL